MKNFGYFIAALYLLFNLNVGCCQIKDSVSTDGYAVRFNKEHNNNLLLIGCMVYAKRLELKYNRNNEFLKIATDFNIRSGLRMNVDSVIDNFIKMNKRIDFESRGAKDTISSFIKNYEIVADVIFAGSDSDEREEEMKALEERMKAVPDVIGIYRSYVKDNPSMASLSSSEGAALLIQLAYFLSIQNAPMRSQIVKKLL